MRFLSVLYLASVAAIVAASPVMDTGSSSLLNEQALLGEGGEPADECQPYGTLCDWPAGSRGPCCAPYLCMPMTTQMSAYLVCS
ncbi:hypothetical protein EDD16DRAFT_1551099 [Pisolithus croceorrhizus]|nr:hypothetical protein EV401DRAFT_1977796 [Pisolithus croceorrhizus]KAI6127941.1 hypothetical protein EDD16DRAFT_1551099 [Pisolithus croceorrhizus]KAI6158548.1 hypothetical protein EDD17DRAFT_1001513 [Pisolithus thermaeus]